MGTFVSPKVVTMKHLLQMVCAMMKQTLLIAFLMEGIAAELASTKTIAQNVFVILTVRHHWIYHVSEI